MHALSICQALLDQVERILLKVGPLSGVESALLQHASPLAAAGTVAEDTTLVIEPAPVRVRCSDCGAESDAAPNRLLCGVCGGWRTRLIRDAARQPGADHPGCAADGHLTEVVHSGAGAGSPR